MLADTKVIHFAENPPSRAFAFKPFRYPLSLVSQARGSAPHWQVIENSVVISRE